jgi:hypothetical protein
MGDTLTVSPPKVGDTEMARSGGRTLRQSQDANATTRSSRISWDGSE